MKTQHCIIVTAAMAVVQVHAFTLTVTDVKIAQRYPWNGLVDIDYTVVCDDPDADIWVYPVGYDKDFDMSIAPQTLTGDGANGQPVKAGNHRITWDMAADMPENWNRKEVSMKIHAYAGAAPYLVVDLSGGPSAESWPVSYLTEMPDEEWPEEYKSSKLVLKLVTPGEFMMGSPVDEVGHDYAGAGYETLHKVKLTQPFYMGVFEVTQKQYELATGSKPMYHGKGEMRPVGAVSYEVIRGSTLGAAWPKHRQVDASSVLGRLRQKTGITFDLPTEAQWEYTCRAGCGSAVNNGRNLSDTSDYTAFSDVARNQSNWNDSKGGYGQGTAAVGSYKPNSWGFYDMHGNVSEWCLDWFSKISETLVIDPVGPNSGTYRIVRGGQCPVRDSGDSFTSYGNREYPAVALRSAARWAQSSGNQYYSKNRPQDAHDARGFRLVALPAE